MKYKDWNISDFLTSTQYGINNPFNAQFRQTINPNEYFNYQRKK